MPKPEKTSKLLSKLIAQTKADAATIKALRTENQQLEAAKQEAVEAAVAEVIALHRPELAAVSNAAAAREVELASSAAAREQEMTTVHGQLLVKLRATEEALADSARENTLLREAQDLLAIAHAKLQAEHAAERARIADLEPRAALIEQQRADLTRLLDKVRDRMRRRELDEERAILNRQALKQVAPALNRG